MDEAKRTGRPSKPAREGRRYQIGVIVTGKTKKLIDEAARASGRTISREVEHLIERALAYDAMLKAMQTTQDEMKKGNVEAELVRQGYTLIRHPHEGKTWKLWAEPNFPDIKRSGFN